MGRHWTAKSPQALLTAAAVGFFVQGCDAKPDESIPANEAQTDDRGPAQADQDPPQIDTKPEPSPSESASGGSTEAGTSGQGPGIGESDPTTGSEDSNAVGTSGGSTDEKADPKPDQKTDPKADDKASKAADIKRLLARAVSTKTDDLEAMGALEQARTLGAKNGRLARNANRRGERLYATPERAIRFFEWANRVDKRYATPSFNLAKIAANRGELPQAKVHLREVAARKGSKLLKTVEFDPTFAVLADDPEIRRLWQR